MERLSTWIKSISLPRFEEDYVDRLNYKVTSYLLLACSLAVLAKEYGGEPIACWGRAEWPSGWLHYAHDICFVENTYYIPINESVPRGSADRERHEINYYQWVPFILALQAVFFNIPHVFWRSLNSTFGIDVRAVITMADSTKAQLKLKDKIDTRDMIVAHLYDCFNTRNKTLSQRKARAKADDELGPLGIITTVKLTLRWFRKNFLGIVYLLTKTLFIINLIGQFFFLGYFLGNSSNFWGFHTLGALTRGETWADTGHFPRVTICDFQVRQLVNIHRHSVQCVLMANMFNEKIFVGLYWWVLLVLGVTFLSFVRWSYWLISSAPQKDFLEELLIPARDIVFPSKEALDEYNTEQNPLSEEIQKKLYILDKAKKKLKVIEETVMNPGMSDDDKKLIKLSKDERDKLELSAAEMDWLNLSEEGKQQLTLSSREKEEVMAWRDDAKKRDEFFDDYGKQIMHRKYYRRTVVENLSSFSSYIGADGILIFRLMDKNAGAFITSAVACSVFKKFADDNGITFEGPMNIFDPNNNEYDFPNAVVLGPGKNGQLP